MNTYFFEEEQKYDGSQLQSLFGYLHHKIPGNSIVSWVGECEIDFNHMVDGEDLLDESKIYSKKMLHFIIEIFNASLKEMVLYQRLLGEVVLRYIAELSNGEVLLRRKGDDLYLMNGKNSSQNLWDPNSVPEKNRDLKFNISIATVSPVSGLMHFGLNIISTDTPVLTYGLDLFSEKLKKPLSNKAFAEEVMIRFKKEFNEIEFATQKVKWVK